MKPKSILIVVIAVISMFALGWLSFYQTGTDANIKIDKQEIKEDVGDAVEEGKKWIGEAEEALDEPHGGDATPTPPTADRQEQQ